ncbi:androgen-dependent TFPI-regulating protein-like [Ostrinia nubilalis]|uniref:androgen-dependent TFPI-regulating protein-like n=1 Tax=Ostrinia nubilalis TaxID=29057 RepID=UPI0030824866
MHLASLDTDVSRTVGYVEHASPVIRSMDKYIYRRIGGNATIFLLLAFNGLVTLISMLTYIPRHPELAILRVLFFRYATIWNVIILLMYSALGFVCDFSIVQREENKVPSKIRELRYKVFHQLVFPCCVGIFFTFWPLYCIDRELIFPSINDTIISKLQNIIVHGFTLLYVCWEMAFLPNILRKKEVNVLPIIMVNTAYFINVLYTKYVEPGIWLYAILEHIEGGIPILLLFFFWIVLPILTFHAQWTVKNVLYRIRDYYLEV